MVSELGMAIECRIICENPPWVAAGRCSGRSDLASVIGTSRATGLPRLVTSYASPASTACSTSPLRLRRSRWEMLVGMHRP